MKIVLIMQHAPTPEQLDAAWRFGVDVVVALDPGKPEARVEGVEYRGSTSLLNVPEDPGLPRDWFVSRAAEILAAVGGVEPGDIVQAMGQLQLTNAINTVARRAGARLVESTTRREGVEKLQPDGTVKKEYVFRFAGFRPVYEF
jgi:hypothetical protein